MKRSTLASLLGASLLSLSLAAVPVARADDGPPPPPQDGGGPGGPNDQGPPGGGGPGGGGPGGFGGGQDNQDRPGRGGPGGGFGGGMGQGRPMPPEMQQVERMRGYLDLVDRFSKISHDPSQTGVAAVITTSDILRKGGSDKAIEFFNKMLPQVKDAAVARAIKLQLIDLYRASGKQDKALELLTDLITGSAPTPAPISAEPGAPR